MILLYVLGAPPPAISAARNVLGAPPPAISAARNVLGAPPPVISAAFNVEGGGFASFIWVRKDMLDFYTVDKEYAKYLHDGEKSVNGVSHVPQLDYGPSRRQKFMCGILLNIGELMYLAPVSSYAVQQKNNILLYNRKGEAMSSVRLNFMIPVYEELIARLNIGEVADIGYKRVLQQEYVSANSQEDAIRKMALNTYRIVTDMMKSGVGVNWACDFTLLETLAHQYKTS